jgi:nicotinate-nucleotide adenylyltransferase
MIMRRLGILGGTFDPVHRGHLEAARAALAHLALDRVLFVPAHVPPHRSRAPRASAFHRFAMTAVAILGERWYAVSDMELLRPGPSFSIETLRSLQAHWQPWQLFFITGADAFAEVETWHGYPAVLDASHFVVVTRPGFPLERLRARLPGLDSRIAVVGDPGTRDGVLERRDTAIVAIDAPTSDVSSTEVRRRLADHEPITGLVPDRVEQYIRQHQLYEPLVTASRLHGQD